jgi:rubrerythrin
VTFAKATLRDGCVGETVASLEAAEASEGATGELRSLLRAIADDEARHATLAFSTVAWLLSTASAEERADIEAFVKSLLHDIDAELAGSTTAPIEAPTEAIDAAWGRVSARDLARLRREGLRGVVRPAVEALLVSPSDRGAGAPRA